MKQNRFLCRSILFTILFSIFSYHAPGREVDVDEIKTAKKIIFQNYKGRYRKQDSVRVIRNIGRRLAAGVKRRGINRQFNYRLKYSMIHAVSKDEPEKLSADIMSIHKRSRIGHINAIRLIIQGYLERMYGYSRRHSKTLSLFITYYNAVYRKNIPYFTGKYKKTVLKNINRTNAGLSTKYSRWPGATRVVIPLTEKAKRGIIDSIDPDIISDKSTRDRIRKDDTNIPDRKNLVDLKKKIIKKEKKKIGKDRERLKRKRRILKDREKRLERKKKKIKKDRKKIRREKEKTERITDPGKRRKGKDKLKRKEKKLKDREKRTEKEEKGITEDRKKIADDGERIKKEEKKITDKEKELDKEKKEIEKDEIKRDIDKDPESAKNRLEEKRAELARKEKELEKREETGREGRSKNIFGDKLYYMKINHWIKDGHYDNELFLINAATRKVILKSPVENIAGRKYDIFKDGVVIITRPGSSRAIHRLTLVDRDTLKAKIFGKENIFFRSFIEIRGDYIYAVIIVKNKYYLGRFNSGLKLVSRSSEEVHEDSFITFFSDYIYINSRDRRIAVFKKGDLKLIEFIVP